MSFSHVNVGNLEHAHVDNRRIIFECNLPTSSIQQFLITAPIPLGNHYHKEKQETFVVTQGQGKCTYLALDEECKPLGSQIVLTLEPGSVIQIMPFTAHAFQLEQGSYMLCFSSTPFDPDNPDMFAYELEI